MYDTITIAPVHTGWWFLLFLVIPLAISIYVWISVRMNNHKMSNGVGYFLQTLLVFSCGAAFLVGAGVPMVTTSGYVTDHQREVITDQLNYKHISISSDHSDRRSFTASTADGKYISGVLIDNGDNVYTVKYTVAP